MDIRVDGRLAHAATGSHEASPDDPAVVLVHGAGMDRTVWQMQTRNIAHRGRRALAVDLPGHGRSDGPALPTIEDMADWLIRFLDAADVTDTALVGHSMGALAALEVAARAPDRVRALALLGIARRMPVHPDLIAAAQAGGPLAPDLIADWGFGRAAHVGGHPAPGLWVQGAGRRVLLNAQAGVLASDLRACDAHRGADAAAALVRCPTLFVIGGDDRMTPPGDATPLLDAIAGADVRTLAGVGHMMMAEAPDETLAALRAIV